MSTQSAIYATVVTALIGILGMLVAKFKCLCKCEDGSLKLCSIGILDHPIVTDEEVELKKINLNGSDLVYVSKSTVQVTGNVNDSDSSSDENQEKINNIV